LDRKTIEKEVIKMRNMKCCPKCGSTNISFLVFYRPSIWRCSDCGYEGTFIIEGSMFAEKMQERYLKRCNIIDWVEGEPRIDSLGGSIDDYQKTLEDHMRSVATIVEDNNYMD
jgi:ribosomal protein L37AE/L43A